MELQLLAPDFTVCQVPDLTRVDLADPFLFLARTDEELSLVCTAGRTPDNATAVETGLRAFRVAGPLDFSLVGILARLASTLADAGVSIFAVSTFNTDYILVRADRLAAAVAALEASGCRFTAAQGDGDR